MKLHLLFRLLRHTPVEKFNSTKIHALVRVVSKKIYQPILIAQTLPGKIVNILAHTPSSYL